MKLVKINVSNDRKNKHLINFQTLFLNGTGIVHVMQYNRAITTKTNNIVVKKPAF